jgi:hypothetical protein
VIQHAKQATSLGNRLGLHELSARTYYPTTTKVFHGLHLEYMFAHIMLEEKHHESTSYTTSLNCILQFMEINGLNSSITLLEEQWLLHKLTYFVL